MVLGADPPGVLYGLSYVLAVYGYSFFIRKSPLKMPKRVISFLLAVGTVALMAVTKDVPQIAFIPTVLVQWTVLFGAMYFANEMDWKQTLYYHIHMVLVGEFTASLQWQLCYFILHNEKIKSILNGKLLFLVCVYVLVHVVVFGVGRNIYRSKAEVELTRRQIVTVAVVFAVVYAMSNISYVAPNTPFSGTLPKEIFNMHTWIDLGGIAILWAYHVQLIESQLKVDFDSMKNILDMQYASYQMSKQSVDLINQKYHDLKHQIHILREEFGSQSGLECLDKMQKEIESYEAQNKTGNKILDTILTGKSLYCQQNDIKLTCVADGHLLDFMDILDISSVFGNALDNAIESVGAIEEKEKKLIHITVCQTKGFVRIKIENCYNRELGFENGLPQTTKADRNYHGYGLKSIKATVKKYSGSVTIEAKDGWFELRILIPLLTAAGNTR